MQKTYPYSTENPLFLFHGEGIWFTASGLDKTCQHSSSNLQPAPLFFPKVLTGTARAGSDPDALLWKCHLFPALGVLADLTHGYTRILHWTKIHIPGVVKGVVSAKWLLTGPVAARTSREVCGSVGVRDVCPPNVEGFVELHDAEAGYNNRF